MQLAATATKTVLTLKERPHVPLEAELLTPDVIAGLDEAGLRSLPLVLGKRQYRCDDFFTIDGPPSEHLEIHGDVGRVKWIGRGMSRGSVLIHGDAGMHLGAHMKGGTIEVRGNTSDWIGAEMHNGLIRIHGNAGGQIGSAYRGSMTGMRGGAILIGGSAGIEVGMRMRRGIIVVGGKVRDFAGLQMKGGDHCPPIRRGDSYRGLDGPRHHHLPCSAQAHADVCVRVQLRADFPSHLRSPSQGLGCHSSLRSAVSSVHGR